MGYNNPIMKQKPEYEIGDTVYLVTDKDQRAFIVTRWAWDGFSFDYEIAHSDSSTVWVKGIEISKDRDILTTLMN